jgi:hypothetical protein
VNNSLFKIDIVFGFPVCKLKNLVDFDLASLKISVILLRRVFNQVSVDVLGKLIVPFTNHSADSMRFRLKAGMTRCFWEGILGLPEIDCTSINPHPTHPFILYILILTQASAEKTGLNKSFVFQV